MTKTISQLEFKKVFGNTMYANLIDHTYQFLLQELKRQKKKYGSSVEHFNVNHPTYKGMLIEADMERRQSGRITFNIRTVMVSSVPFSDDMLDRYNLYRKAFNDMERKGQGAITTINYQDTEIHENTH